MMFAYCNNLHAEDWTVIGTFSSHWAACAAMIRMREPDFRSLGGDKAEDLAEEVRIATAMYLHKHGGET